MNGSEKQIAYAENLKNAKITELNDLIVNKTSKIKPIEGPRAEMRAKMNPIIETGISHLRTVVTALENYDGDAGELIDGIKNVITENNIINSWDFWIKRSGFAKLGIRN